MTNILDTIYHYHRGKNSTKEDVRSIGEALNIIKAVNFNLSSSILPTWVKLYRDSGIVHDVIDIARVLKVVKGEREPIRREA